MLSSLYYFGLGCLLVSVSAAIAVQTQSVSAPPTERPPECQVSVKGGQVVSLSPYKHYYQIAESAQTQILEVTYNLPLNPLSGDYGNQSFWLFFEKPNEPLKHVTCSESVGLTCLLKYNVSINPTNKPDDLQYWRVNFSDDLYIRSNGYNICFLQIWVGEKSVDIKAVLSWYKHTDVVYELIIDVQQGFPDPTIGPLLCDGVAVDGVVETKRGGYLITDMDKLRDYTECKVNISNSISTPSFSLPLLPPRTTTEPTVRTTTRETVTDAQTSQETVSESLKSSTENKDYIIITTLIAVVVVLAVIIVGLVVALLYVCKKKKSETSITNNIFQSGQKYTNYDEDNESKRSDSIKQELSDTSSIPVHQPTVDGARSMESYSSSGFDEADGGEDEWSAGDDSLERSNEMRPISETCVDNPDSITSDDEMSAGLRTPDEGEGKEVETLDENR